MADVYEPQDNVKVFNLILLSMGFNSVEDMISKIKVSDGSPTGPSDTPTGVLIFNKENNTAYISAGGGDFGPIGTPVSFRGGHSIK